MDDLENIESRLKHQRQEESEQWFQLLNIAALDGSVGILGVVLLIVERL